MRMGGAAVNRRGCVASPLRFDFLCFKRLWATHVSSDLLQDQFTVITKGYIVHAGIRRLGPCELHPLFKDRIEVCGDEA